MSKYNEFREKYPNAFLSDGSPYGFLLFGFECGEGWADLLEPLFDHIDRHNMGEIGKYEELPNFVLIRQVKEKFGTLRFYHDGSTKVLDKLVDEAEKKSETTCEVCGKDGSIKGKNWVYVACEEHIKIGDK